jgi:hypothetical protein
MRTSDSIKSIAPALVQAQKGITFASKDGVNPHFKNKYASLSSVIDAIKPALNDAGIVFVQTASPSDDNKLHLTTRLIHVSGEWIEDVATCPLSKQDAQGFGSCMSYLRRYSLASITGLYQDDDDAQSALAPSFNIDSLINLLHSSKDMAELQVNYLNALAQVKNNPKASADLVREKDKMKGMLNAIE